MSAEARIERYEQAYQDDYGYEAWLVRARRGATLAAMKGARRVVEIGCGTEPLFGEAGDQADAVERWVTVEPAEAFRREAEALGIAYLPLFAIPTFFEIDRDRPKDFDLYFVGAIGTLHRFDALARLHAFAEQHGLATHFHLVCSPVMRATLLRKRKPMVRAGKPPRAA